MPKSSVNVKTKLPKVGTTIFSKMSALAAQEKALNLSQGFPDFDCNPRLQELLTKAMNSGMNQYAPMPGLLNLREAISQKTESLYSGYYHPETEVTVTAGATQAIFTAITATIKEEDEVIVFTPAYDCYEPAIELMGGKTVHVELKSPDYKIDWDFVKKCINQRTRMIILNTPHNPTGTIASAQDLLTLEKLLENTEIIVLSDEVYEHIIFDGYDHQSVARFPTLAERSFIVSSFGKTYHTTGWKIGYCLAPKELMVEFRKAHQYNVFSVHTPSQQAYAEYLKESEDHLELASFYQSKRDLFKESITTSRFKIGETAGSYFQLLDYSAISDEADISFAERITREHKIASIPTSVFYHRAVEEWVLRFCFAKRDETLLQAAEIINKI